MAEPPRTDPDFLSYVAEYLSFEDPNMTIAVAAVIIALLTALFTAYQAFLSRKHNRLSVKPHLTTWIDDSSDNKFYVIRCDLMNNGIGPAIIKKFEVFFEGEKIGDNQDRQALEAAIKEKIEAQSGIIRHSVSVLGKDFPFPSGSRITLLELHIANHIGFDKKPYQDFIDKFDADFVYHSMYGQAWEHSTKDNKDKT